MLILQVRFTRGPRSSSRTIATPKALCFLALFAFSALVGCGSGGSVPTSAPTLHNYTIADLSLPNWDGIVGPVAMNNSGEVVGTADIYPIQHAFLYSKGKTTDLGAQFKNISQANAINDSGQVAGALALGTFSQGATSLAITHAFLYSHGVFTDLGTLGGRDSFALGINASGIVVGSSNVPGPIVEIEPSHAFLWDGTIHDLFANASLGFFPSAATGINDSGQIIGPDYLYSKGVFKTLDGLFKGGLSTPTAINNLGQIVGHTDTDTAPNRTQHAFLYSDGNLKDLGALGGPANYSYANGINNFGQIVGYSYPSSTSGGVAFIYTSAGGTIDLNTLLPSGSGWQLLTADAINDRGQIAGHGFHNGLVTAFLMTPGQ